MNAGLRVGAAIESLAGTDTALAADCGVLDKCGGADNGSGRSEIDDDDRVDDQTDDTEEVAADDGASWQHRRVSSGCIADKIGFWYKGYGTLGAQGGCKMAEVAG